MRTLVRSGALVEQEYDDEEQHWLDCDADGDDTLGQLQGASIRYRIAVRPIAGRKTLRLQTPGVGLEGQAPVKVETVGSSTRTIFRLFKSQTRLSFQAWRQQCRLMRGMELLAAGSSVTTVALDVGYDGASAFIAMFHRTVGVTPAQYAQSLSP